MTAILTTLLGGLLAIAGGLVGIALTDRRDRNRWLRDSQLQASTELITALQLLTRRMINVAYLDPAESGSYDLQEFAKRRPQNPRAAAVMAAFDDATAEWNSARHKALLVAPPRLAEKIPELDHEVDRLLDSSHAQIWTRAEFRQQRIRLGRMAADYLKLARRLAGLPDIELISIWAWDTGNPARTASARASSEHQPSVKLPPEPSAQSQ